MTYFNHTLRQTDWDLFDSMSAALGDMPQGDAIEYRPLNGFPFAWLLHPGFNDGLTVGDSSSIYRLRETGLISVYQTPEARQEGRIALTPQGRNLFEQRRQMPAGHPERGGTDKPSFARRGFHRK
jgi:hypothetical protein